MRLLAFILMLTTFFTTISYPTEVGTLAQTFEVSTTTQAFIDARADAEKDVDRRQWVVSGCCTGIIGWPVSPDTAPEIPIERIMGKSPEYIYFYFHEYNRKTKELQSHYAGMGSLVATVAVALFAYFILKQSNPLNPELPWRSMVPTT